MKDGHKYILVAEDDMQIWENEKTLPASLLR